MYYYYYYYFVCNQLEVFETLHSFLNDNSLDLSKEVRNDIVLYLTSHLLTKECTPVIFGRSFCVDMFRNLVNVIYFDMTT